MRRDLVVVPASDRDDAWYSVKDPIALNYFRLRRDELFVLQQLDGRIPWHVLKERYDAQFMPQRATVAELQQLVYRFHQFGIVLSDGGDQAQVMLERARSERQRKWLSTVSSLLFLRLPGVDPDRWLSRVYPLLSWTMSPLSLACSVVWILSALLLVLVNWGQFLERLPPLEQLFSGTSLIAFLAALSMTKVIHELGHAFVCKHLGGECHEIGPMILVFTPALYCDTSDSWLLSNRWHRIAVGLAGIYVELVIAALAVFIWWYTQDGWLHYLCIRVIMVSSISTILINANPLLRYDGYYVLADLIDQPNLAQVSRRLVIDWLRYLTCGIPVETDEISGWRARIGYLGYGIAAWIYRWCIVLGVIYLLPIWAEPHGLSSLAYGAGAMTLLGMCGVPMWQLYQWLQQPGQFKNMKRSHLTRAGLVVGMLGAATVLIPLPHSVMAPVELRPANGKAIYVTTEGRLQDLPVLPGDAVAADTVVAQLENRSLRLEVEQARSQRDQQASQLSAWRALQTRDPEAASRIPVAEATLRELEEQLRERISQLEGLSIEAGLAGRLIPAPAIPQHQPPNALPEWSGSLYETANRGCLLQRGTLLGWIAPENGWEVEAQIAQDDIGFVQEGQSVKISLAAYPGEVLRGTVMAVSEGIEETEETTDSSEPFAVRNPPATYRARLLLDTSPLALTRGMIGVSAIEVQRQTLGQWLQRKIASMARIR